MDKPRVAASRQDNYDYDIYDSNMIQVSLRRQSVQLEIFRRYISKSYLGVLLA